MEKTKGLEEVIREKEYEIDKMISKNETLTKDTYKMNTEKKTS